MEMYYLRIWIETLANSQCIQRKKHCRWLWTNSIDKPKRGKKTKQILRKWWEFIEWVLKERALLMWCYSGCKLNASTKWKSVELTKYPKCVPKVRAIIGIMSPNSCLNSNFTHFHLIEWAKIIIFLKNLNQN